DRRAEAIKPTCGQSRDAVVAPLETKRRPARSRNLSAACAPAAVRRKDGDVIGEGEHVIAQRVVRRSGELGGELGPEQIDTRDLSNKERAARKEVLRIVGAPQIRDEIGDVLRRVP